jgi:hypothetical protein
MLTTIPDTFGSGGANIAPGNSAGTPVLRDVLRELQAQTDEGGYTPTNDADWVDPNPATIREALDRLASAVEGLLAAPIP